ncbi:hypothetical protein LRM36_00220 [Stenotrophomonas maltophilia]|nr:hypothetical protein [Stenotrophomonas maltophilia]
MNKIAIALSAALSLGAAASASAQTATLDFTGEIVAGTCAVDVGSGGTINLLPVTPAALASDGAAGSQRVKLSLKAGTGTGDACDKNTAILTAAKAGLTANGNVDNTHTATADAPKSNVVVQILNVDDSNKVVNLQTESIQTAITGAPRAGEINLEARYVVEGGAAATGGLYTGRLVFNVANR